MIPLRQPDFKSPVTRVPSATPHSSRMVAEGGCLKGGDCQRPGLAGAMASLPYSQVLLHQGMAPALCGLVGRRGVVRLGIPRHLIFPAPAHAGLTTQHS